MDARPFPTVPGLRAASQPAAALAVWLRGIFSSAALPAIARGDDAGASPGSGHIVVPSDIHLQLQWSY